MFRGGLSSLTPPIELSGSRAVQQPAATSNRDPDCEPVRNPRWSVQFPPSAPGKASRRQGEHELPRRDAARVRRLRIATIPDPMDGALRRAWRHLSSAHISRARDRVNEIETAPKEMAMTPAISR